MFPRLCIGDDDNKRASPAYTLSLNVTSKVMMLRPHMTGKSRASKLVLFYLDLPYLSIYHTLSNTDLPQARRHDDMANDDGNTPVPRDVKEKT